MDFPQVPNMHALVMLLMTGVALFLFSREKIHIGVVQPRDPRDGGGWFRTISV